MCRACASTVVMSGIMPVEVVITEDGASLHTVKIGEGCKWVKAEHRTNCFRQMNQVFVKSSLPRSQTSMACSSIDEELHDKPAVNMATIHNFLQKESFSALHQSHDGKISLYISDTGGQFEFQESLPLLIAGRAIFVFLFPLHIDVNHHVSVSYRMKVGDEIKHSNVFRSSLTIKESFLQTLASIDSMETFCDPSIAKHKPYVFVVGTHKDCLVAQLGASGAERRIAEIDNAITTLVNDHSYGKLVDYAERDAGQILFAVDNTCENGIFQAIRSRIMERVNTEEFHIQFPLSYLLASLHLDEVQEPFVKRDAFARDVLNFGVKEEDLDYLLQFLHCRVGQIRYYSTVKELKNLIVRQPQLMYDLVTCLLTQSFISKNVTINELSEIERGIYSSSFFQTTELALHSEFIDPDELIHLLQELRIAAPFCDNDSNEKKYFIPCVLNHLPVPPHEDKVSIVQSLVISFNRGHCSKGLFGVLLHTILTNKEKRLEWNLDISKIFKDQVSFEVGPYKDVATIKFCTTHLEVMFQPADVLDRSTVLSIKIICNIVRSTVLNGIEQATKRLHYNQMKTSYSLGVMCTECAVEHMIVEVENERWVKCLHEYCRLPDSGCFWFGGKMPISYCAYLFIYACIHAVTPTYCLPDLIDSHVICLKEGDSKHLEFAVTSDPPLDPPHHTLLRLEGPHCSRNVYIHCNAIVFERVNRRDAGNYCISCFNVVGEGNANFKLRVKCELQTDYTSTVASTLKSMQTF